MNLSLYTLASIYKQHVRNHHVRIQLVRNQGAICMLILRKHAGRAKMLTAQMWVANMLITNSSANALCHLLNCFDRLNCPIRYIYIYIYICICLFVFVHIFLFPNIIYLYLFIPHLVRVELLDFLRPQSFVPPPLLLPSSSSSSSSSSDYTPPLPPQFSFDWDPFGASTSMASCCFLLLFPQLSFDWDPFGASTSIVLLE